MKQFFDWLGALAWTALWFTALTCVVLWVLF